MLVQFSKIQLSCNILHDFFLIHPVGLCYRSKIISLGICCPSRFTLSPFLFLVFLESYFIRKYLSSYFEFTLTLVSLTLAYIIWITGNFELLNSSVKGIILWMLYPWMVVIELLYLWFNCEMMISNLINFFTEGCAIGVHASISIMWQWLITLDGSMWQPH